MTSMKRHLHFLILLLFFLFSETILCYSQQNETLIYHTIKTGKAGKIIPWYNENTGKSYSHVIGLVWNFWDTMRRDINGLPYYMNHQV